MFLLLLGVSIVSLVVFLLLRKKYPSYNDFGVGAFFTFMSWTFGFLVLGFIVATVFTWKSVATESVIDDKIEMYQKENTRIEQEIDRIVEAYMEYEHDTFTDLKMGESLFTLVTLFPELKSDTLVQQQLEIYIANNAKIKELKEEKINLTVSKWWLYFGK